ncbi:MAG TPA: hypothetical protein VMW08_19250 [Acidimicrobiales bacterium]|nr:hypothetical protein [Acidimicrobiales bacterium]
MGSTRRLVFVYDVDASPVALLGDLGARIITGHPDCRLRDLTFGRILKDRSWKTFVGGLPCEVDFELRSTFRKRPDVPRSATFPAVYLDAPAGLIEVITSKELDDLDDLDGLRSLVSGVVEGLGR